MKNKKIVLSIILVLITIISISAVSAVDNTKLNQTNDVSSFNDYSDENILSKENLNEDNIYENNPNEAIDSSTLEIEKTISNNKVLKEDSDNIIIPETDDVEGIINAVNKAQSGDIVSLKENFVYEVGNSTINLTTANVTIKGNGATINLDGVGQGGQLSVFEIRARGVVIDGITFNNTNGPKKYGEELQGYAINLRSTYVLINNCSFLNLRAGIGSRDSCSYSNITNCYFSGSATHVTNTGNQESGTKAINILGSHHIYIENNTFEGQLLDGISMATGSGNNKVINNKFIENCYAIYFGGASTQNTVIENNSFIRCGYCKDADGNYLFQNLPVISAQKSADGFVVTNNYFLALNNSYIITAESGNTKHGYPSEIGNITITNNTVRIEEGVSAESVTFIYVFSNSGALTPYGDLVFVNNTFDSGIKPVVVWYNDWGNRDGDVIIPKASKVASSIKVVNISTFYETITIVLKDINDEAIPGALIEYMISSNNTKSDSETNTSDENTENDTLDENATVEGDTQSGITDENGLLTIKAPENGIISIAFSGDDTYDSSTCSISFESTKKEKLSSLILAKNMTTTAVASVDSRTGEYFNITLADSNGNPIINKAIRIGFNANIYDRVTDENGKASLQINLKNKGIYTFAISFLGDDDYNASFEVVKITVQTQTPQLTTKNVNYKVSAKTKTISATFKSKRGTAVSGKKITFTVNGKTYTGTTNSKGVASVKVTLNKKGTYKFTAKYAGDNTYSAVTKTGSIVIKV